MQALGTGAEALVFLTPTNVGEVLSSVGLLSTAWKLANLPLESLGADLLGDEASRIVGLSEATTCYVSPASFEDEDRFADYVVHEAAHVCYDCTRATLWLPSIRTREWLLPIAFRQRETFAYACEAYSRTARTRAFAFASSAAASLVIAATSASGGTTVEPPKARAASPARARPDASASTRIFSWSR